MGCVLPTLVGVSRLVELEDIVSAVSEDVGLALLENDNEVLDLIGSSLAVDEGDGGRLEVTDALVEAVVRFHDNGVLDVNGSDEEALL